MKNLICGFAFISTILLYSSYLISVFTIFTPIKKRDNFSFGILSVLVWIFWILSLVAVYKTEEPTIHVTLTFANLIYLGLFWKMVDTAKRNRLTVIFSKDVPEKIVGNGLYRFVRHPFYAVYIYSYISAALILANFELLILCLPIIFIYFFAARQEEMKFSKSDLSADYELYRQRTGMLFPKIFRLRKKLAKQ